MSVRAGEPGPRGLAQARPLSAAAMLRARVVFGRVPRVAWACALVMLANGIAWSLIVPPFEVPDENAHYAYVQQVAERGTVARHVVREGELSPAEDAMLGAVGFYEVVGEAKNPALMSELQQKTVDAAGTARLSKRGSGNALSATDNPPLYYALQAVPYEIGSSGTVLDRITLMRLLSASMGAMTVLFIYMFLSELLPGRRWAWTTGALVAAFQPLFAFMAGGVNGDVLVYLTSAGLLWSLARAFRRGLTPAGGALIGGFLGLDLITKFNALGFVPAVGLALAVMLRRAWTSDRGPAMRGAAYALAVALVPVLAYLALNHLIWHRGAIPGGIGSVPAAPGATRHFNLREELSHIWQLFLPPVGMRHQFVHLPLWHTWFQGFMGRFGWLDYEFPLPFYRVALVISVLVGLAAVAELVRCRGAFMRRAAELAVYVLALGGTCVEIGVQSYRLWVQSGGFGQFEQARYMLPLLCLYAAIVALAARLGGRRWGPAIGTLLVLIAVAHNLAAQAITVARYYS